MHKKLFEIARKVYHEHALTPAAKKVFYQLIKDDAELVKLALDFAIEEALDLAQRHMRALITRDPAAAEASSTNGEKDHGGPRHYSRSLQRAVVAACGLYYQFPMMDGTTLAHARKEHVAKDASRYWKNSHGNRFKAEFLDLVGAGMDQTQKVADAWTEEELRELASNARKKTNRFKKSKEMKPPQIA